MFSSKKSIFIYSIILLYFTTSVFGTLIDGVWCEETDPDIVTINKLFEGPCKHILEEMIAKFPKEIAFKPPAKAVSKVNLQQEGKGKANHTGIIAIKDSTPANEDAFIEGIIFTMTCDYMNLNGADVDDKYRLKLAGDKAQNLTTSLTLQSAKENAEATVKAAGVIEMARPIIRAVSKKYNQLSGHLRKKSTSTSSNKSSSSSSNTQTVPIATKQQKQREDSSSLYESYEK